MREDGTRTASKREVHELASFKLQRDTSYSHVAPQKWKCYGLRQVLLADNSPVRIKSILQKSEVTLELFPHLALSTSAAAFPFALSKDDAIIQLGPFAPISCIYKDLLNFLRACFFGSGTPTQPAKIEAVYLPSWFVDAEVEANAWVTATDVPVGCKLAHIELVSNSVCLVFRKWLLLPL